MHVVVLLILRTKYSKLERINASGPTLLAEARCCRFRGAPQKMCLGRRRLLWRGDSRGFEAGRKTEGLFR